jgi:excisionase family DNA binding protein
MHEPVNGRAMLTVPELARQWGVSRNKIVAWITSGQLGAINFALQSGGRPRWKIPAEAVAAFEAGRSAVPTMPRVQRRRKLEATAYF